MTYIEYANKKCEVNMPNFRKAKDGDKYHMDFEGCYLIEMEKQGDKLVSTGKAMDGRGSPYTLEKELTYTLGA